MNCLDKMLPDKKCSICGEIWNEKTKLVDKAFQKEVNNIKITCDKCDWSDILLNYSDHYNEKHAEKVCQYCQKRFDNQNLLNTHLEKYPNGSCKNKLFSCTYCDIGCTRELLGENELEKHLKLDVSKHLNYFFLHVKGVNRGTRFNALSNDDKILEEKINKQLLDNTALATLQQEHKDQLMSMCSNQEKLSHELEISRNNEKQLRDELEELKKRLTVAQVTIIDLEQRLMQQEKTSNNGTLVWKLLNVKERIIEAKSGKQTSVYSPIFYTHPNGYKMRCRIYLNGDGMGRGTHVSLFFVLMKGEYDGLLNRPFRQKVTFTLIDQSVNESREHITDAFKPDPKSSSFIRPVSEMNIASGIPLFCSLPKLHSTDHEYIKDDVMFIKIVVDTRDLNDI